MKRQRNVIILGTVAALSVLGLSRAHAGLVIVPTFDSSITSDPNAAAIENTINTAINAYETTFVNNITINITFREITNAVGSKSASEFVVPYAEFRAALAAQAQSADVATALANLPNTTNNPVTNTPDLLLKSADIKALGITGIALPASDGTIGLDTNLTFPGSPGSNLEYNLLPVVEHEIDEVLGLGSSLDLPIGSPPSPEDLYRYDANGNRSFTTADTPNIFFSLNGTTDLAQFDNQGDGGEYGDWQSNPLPNGVPPQVQDAWYLTPGASRTLSVELQALNVIGYEYSLAPILVLEPSTLTSAGLGVVALWGCWLRRRGRAAS